MAYRLIEGLYFLTLRPRNTAKPPANNVSPAIAEAGSISGARATIAVVATVAETAPANAINANAAAIFVTIMDSLHSVGRREENSI
jgi:hypothetical protein